jgi:hypothetical protein
MKKNKIKNMMLFLDVLVRSRSKAAMGMRPNTTPLAEMYFHLWREVLSLFREPESA